MKRIALITDGIWPYVIGGMQKHSYYLCKYFAENGIHVDLIHFNKSDRDISKLEFFSQKEKEFIHPTIIEMPLSTSFPGHYIRNSYKHSKLIFDHLKPKLENYDLIYTKGFTGWYLIDQKSKGHIKCCKIGVNFHGYEMFQKQPDLRSQLKTLLFRGPVKTINRKADLVFSYGGKITNIISSLGVSVQKIIECPSGIEEEYITDKINLTGDKKRFLFLGRYERRKGIEELNGAIQQLISKKIENFEFHFIGPIPNEKKINHTNVIYHGEVRDRDSLNNKIKQCDILICPSYSEGFPNVILEAMSNGLAVAATPVGAVELLVDPNCGYILKDSSNDYIFKTLESIIFESKTTVDHKKQRSVEKIKNHFTWKIIFKAFLTTLEKKL